MAAYVPDVLFCGHLGARLRIPQMPLQSPIEPLGWYGPARHLSTYLAILAILLPAYLRFLMVFPILPRSMFRRAIN
jgi:hypothetical protein